MSRYKDKIEGEKRRRKAYDYFIDKGLEPHQAAGIIGNLMQESYKHLDSTVENRIGAVGIAQWLGPRRQDLEKFAKNRGTSFKDFDTQLDFLYTELVNTGNSWGSKAQKEFFESKTAEEAAAIFVEKFERSGEKAGEKGYDNRINYAKSIFLEYNDNTIYGKDESGNIVNIDPSTATPEQIAVAPKIKAEFYDKHFKIPSEKHTAEFKETPKESKAKEAILVRAKDIITKPAAPPVPEENEDVPPPYDFNITPEGNEFFNFFLPE